MSIAIMQPYFLPYLGYFRLLACVDHFVFLDNVNFINKGWINRNRILINHKASLFTLPLVKASQNKIINEIDIDLIRWQHAKFLKSIFYNYKKAPYFSAVFPLVEAIISFPNPNLVSYILHSFTLILKYLNIDCRIHLASKIQDKSTKGANYLIELCQLMRETLYVNLSGGKVLYQPEQFSQAGITLAFIPAETFYYCQEAAEFVENLSIIDVLMFNEPKILLQNLRATQLEFADAHSARATA
jgi:hypothetical protein